MAIFLGRRDVEQLLSMHACIDVVREGLKTFSSGGVVAPLRQIMDLPEQAAMLGLMPGWLNEPKSFGVKVMSVYPDNHRTGRPSHQGLVLVFDAETGALIGGVDGGTITAIRTAAASAVATDALARPESTTLALLGVGLQARMHLNAMRQIRPINHVRVWGRDARKVEQFVEENGDPALHFAVADTPTECVDAADIVCTITASADPILQAQDVGLGTHLNIVGSSRAKEAEIDGALLGKARVYADSRQGMISQGGEFLRAKAAGLFDESEIVGEIGELLLGKVPGRITQDDITLFKSLGHIVEDLVSAHFVLSSARAAGLGVSVEL